MTDFESSSNIPPLTGQTRFWKIAPGENAFLWDEWRANNYIAIGWPAIGDATAISREEFEKRRSEIESQPQRYEAAARYNRRGANQLWTFAHSIQVGDRIIANRGTSQVLGIGVVTGPCEFHPDADHQYLHRIPVMWIDLEPKTVQQGGWLKTLIELNREHFMSITNTPQNTEKVEPVPAPAPVAMNSHRFSLNQILYGAPGTGKTYSSIARAVEIIDGFVAGEREAVVKRYEELRKAGQIGFVTFHQSFAYEEFVEGLRPVLDDESDGTARYEIADGVFKQMALRALAATLQFPAQMPGDKPSFDELWEELLNRIEDEKIDEAQGISNGSYRLSVTPRGKISGDPIKGNPQRPYTASRSIVREVWDKLGDEEEPTRNRQKAILKRDAYFYLIGAIIKQLREIANKGSSPIQAIDTQKRTIGIEDVQAWLSGSSDLELSQNTPPRFVLIIDEINRGNIARIFGELITLLEADKRLGAPNQLRVTLPYSKDSFGVPGNLHLLGTMNTADKSLALLDIALRRRFEFEELRPDFSAAVCPGLDAAMRAVLNTLNARLMRVLDREHRLGHAPWIRVRNRQQWNEVFLRQIVPLLQEYFYNDWDNLRAVLGENGEGTIVRELAALDGLKSRTRHAWWFDCDEASAVPDFLAVLAQNFKQEAVEGGDGF